MKKLKDVKVIKNSDEKISRINRIIGQLEGIRNMISTSRKCCEIMAQTRAVKRALHSLEASILDHYVREFVECTCSGKLEEGTQRIEELIRLFRKE